MDPNLKAVLDRARKQDLRAIRTEAGPFGNVYAVKATVCLGNQEFSAHAVVETPHLLVQAESEAIVRACQFAGIVVEGGAAPVAPPLPPAPRKEMFLNPAPLVPDDLPTEPFTESFTESFTDEPFAEEDEYGEAIPDRQSLMDESTALMNALKLTKQEGRTYLLNTFKKNVRDALTDEELYQFVKYLRSRQQISAPPGLPF